MSLYAGLDVGTQGVKLLVYDADGRRVVATTSAPLRLVARDDGSREQEAAWWIDGMHSCFAALDATLRGRISAMGVSGQQHGFVALDAQGAVLAPVKLWCDTSTQSECDDILQAIGGQANCIALTGNPLLVGYTASKVRWMRNQLPDAYRRLSTILLPHDYINFHLTGERVCEAGDASGTGLLDVRKREWSLDMLLAIDPQRDLKACLPTMVQPDAVFEMLPAVAQSLGLSPGVLVSAGGGDNMMAAIGTGCVLPGRLSMSLGTSGTLFTCADRALIEPRGAWAAFCSSSGTWLPLICTMNCTVATETMARLCGAAGGDGDAFLASTAPGAAGLNLLPFFNGERTPDLPDARASLHGIDVDNMTPAHLYRAAMEGATYTLRHGYDLFCAGGMRFESVVLTGGGSKSAQWRQMVADVFALPVHVPRHAEGAAFGAALQALWATQRRQGGALRLDETTALHVALDATLSATPDPRRVVAYREPYARFCSLLQREVIEDRKRLCAPVQMRSAGATA